MAGSCDTALSFYLESFGLDSDGLKNSHNTLQISPSVCQSFNCFSAHCGDCEKDSSPWGDLQQGVCEISLFIGCLKGMSMFFSKMFFFNL